MNPCEIDLCSALITFARLSRGVVMVNECVGPDSDGCTANSVTTAKYGTHSRDGGTSFAGRVTGRNTSAPAGVGRSLPIPPSKKSTRHVESMQSTPRTVALLESPQDREATVKTLLMVLGCKCAASRMHAFFAAPHLFSRLGEAFLISRRVGPLPPAWTPRAPTEKQKHMVATGLQPLHLSLR
jgi:hypothetical protein